MDDYNEKLRELYRHVLNEDSVYLPLPVLLDRLIDPLVAVRTSYPAFKLILLGSDISPEIAAAAARMQKETTERIKAFIRLSAPGMKEDRVSLVANVCKAVVKAMLSLLAPPSAGSSRRRSARK